MLANISPLIVALLLCLPLTAQKAGESLGDFARRTQPAARGECGMVYGEAHAFTVCAPKGWVLDNSILSEQGIYAAFYPEDSTWEAAKDNGSVMYINTARKDEKTSTVAAMMQTDAEDTRAKSPAVIVGETRIGTNNDEVRVQKFTHSEFNRYEAVAYRDSPKIIVMFVITSKNLECFRRDYSAFEQLVKSYNFLTTNVSTPLETARAAVNSNMQTPEGRHYDQVIGTEFGKKYVSIMAQCAQGASGDLGEFDIFMKLDNSGVVKDVLLSPATRVAVCLKQKLANDQFSPPPRPFYWVNINMQIAP